MIKKGQLSLFIMIGVVILAIVGIGLFMVSTNNLDDATLEIAIDSIPIRSYIEGCLEETLAEGLVFVGLQGGYYIPPDDYVMNLGFKVPIYHDQIDGDMMPDMDTIEKQIEYYVIDNINVCLKDFEVFSEMGMTIVESGREFDVTVFDDEVRLDLSDRILVSFEGKTHEFNEFSAKALAPLGLIWDYSRLYIDAQSVTPDIEPLGYLMRLAYENDFSFETMYLDDTYIYAFNKNMTEEYIFVFAIKYDWSDS